MLHYQDKNSSQYALPHNQNNPISHDLYTTYIIISLIIEYITYTVICIDSPIQYCDCCSVLFLSKLSPT